MAFRSTRSRPGISIHRSMPRSSRIPHSRPGSKSGLRRAGGAKSRSSSAPAFSSPQPRPLSSTDTCSMSTAASPPRSDRKHPLSHRGDVEMPRSVALIGAGAMGGAIGTRLARANTRLLVFDLDPAKVATLVEKGASAATTAANAAAAAGAVILSLNSPQIVRAAVFGSAGVAEGARKGTLIIDMSSIDPEATRALAKEASAVGLRWVDSPLSGGAAKALLGQLTCMAGGDAADVAEARTVLAEVASNFTHMGPSGAGQTTKLINQVLCALNFLAVAEATALAEASGVDA